MERRQASIIKAGDIEAKARWHSQRLNEASRFRGTDLAREGGLKRLGVSWATLPPGSDSFAYHAHAVEEEWMFILSGHAVALIDGAEVPLDAGDFVSFPAPQVPHLLMNRSGEDVVYLMGGERPPMDVIDFPTLGRRYLLRGEGGRAAFYPLASPDFPFGREE